MQTQCPKGQLGMLGAGSRRAAPPPGAVRGPGPGRRGGSFTAAWFPNPHPLAAPLLLGLGHTPCIKGLLKKKRTKHLWGKLPLEASPVLTALPEGSSCFQNDVTAAETQSESYFLIVVHQQAPRCPLPLARLRVFSNLRNK